METDVSKALIWACLIAIVIAIGACTVDDIVEKRTAIAAGLCQEPRVGSNYTSWTRCK